MSLKDEVAKLRAENEALKAKMASPPRSLSLKVSDKGGVSVYGLGRFPVTLYRSQWERLISFSPEIVSFIDTHKANLKEKQA